MKKIYLDFTRAEFYAGGGRNLQSAITSTISFQTLSFFHSLFTSTASSCPPKIGLQTLTDGQPEPHQTFNFKPEYLRNRKSHVHHIKKYKRETASSLSNGVKKSIKNRPQMPFFDPPTFSNSQKNMFLVTFHFQTFTPSNSSTFLQSVQKS